jgi:ADP-dependent NAD(P)H-hydrate dehydratase / NAD(P)H-hydrate epimerase
VKVLTAEQMRQADRLAIERGIPGEVLMENAGRAVAEFLEREFIPLSDQRVLIFCGKGNNGGDGLVVARLLQERGAAVEIVRAEKLGKPEMTSPTIVVDALLGTGFREPLKDPYPELIRSINEDYPSAKIVAVDIPSAMRVHAGYTVTFAALKLDLAMGEGAGKTIVADIGIPADLIQSEVELSEARDFAALFRPRKPDSNKGDFGHVLVIGGAPGKTGAAAMSGLAALRAGAGLVTVASSGATYAPELMTEPIGDFSLSRKTVIAVGPGLGPNRDLVVRLLREVAVPMVIDADALNSIAGTDFRGRGEQTILTPHPGEMARLTGSKVTDRLAVAKGFAQERNVCVVLKGYRTLIAFPDGRVWINPTGSPAMATGGTGDILTGMTAGLVAQFPGELRTAVRAAVWLHGRAGEIGAAELTEQCLIATDLLRYLPNAIRECVNAFEKCVNG